MQWSPAQFEAYGEYYSSSRVYTRIEPQTTYEVSFAVEGTAEIVLKRFLGCILIAVMPDEGLEEALLSLRDMLQFYTHKPSPGPARLAPKAINATIADKKKRPNLVIA